MPIRLNQQSSLFFCGCNPPADPGKMAIHRFSMGNEMIPTGIQQIG